jgi:hypothetical protein
VKGGIPLGGFLENLQDTRKDLYITRNSRGLDEKQRVIFFLCTEMDGTDRSSSAHRNVVKRRDSWQLGVWVRHKTERGDQRDRGGRRTEVAGFWRGAAGGGARRRLVSS